MFVFLRRLLSDFGIGTDNQRETNSSDDMTASFLYSRIEVRPQPRWQFWLPLLAIGCVVLLNSARLQYADAPGGEIYGDLQGNSTVRRLSYLFLGGVGCLLAVGKPRQFKTTPNAVVGFSLALMAYVLATAFWSEDPGTTFKRTVLLGCIVAVGYGISRAWSLRDFVSAICILSCIFLLVGIAAEIRYGTFLTGGAAYRFAGVFHPAKQAFNCGTLVLASVTLYFQQKNKLMLLIAAVACVFLLLTKARTGVGATLVASCVLLLPHLTRGWLASLLVIGMLVISAGLITLGGKDHKIDAIAIGSMGRDREQADPRKLTGRLTIWSQALEEYSHRPVLGFGYGAFWSIERQARFARRNGWSPAHAHSGYIECLVSLGAVGVIAISALACFVLWKALSCKHTKLARFMVAYMVFALIASLAETAFVSDGYQLICLIAGSFLIAHEQAGDCLRIDSMGTVVNRLSIDSQSQFQTQGTG